MTDNVENELRRIFADDAERAPVSESLALDVSRKVRRNRRVRAAWTAGSLVAAASVAIAVIGGGETPGSQGGRDQIAASDVIQGSGPLPGNGAGRCVEDYTASAAIGRSFAFDGTVAKIDPGDNEQASGYLGLVSVTFAVNEWFVGGSGDTVTISMMPPDPANGQSQDSAAIYEVGTRLLVSGEPRWGGAPLEDAVAWGCDFTRYYDQATADAWRAELGRGEQDATM